MALAIVSTGTARAILAIAGVIALVLWTAAQAGLSNWTMVVIFAATLILRFRKVQ